MLAVTSQEPKSGTSFSTHPEVSVMVWVAICYSDGGCGGLVTNGYRCLVYQISESDFVGRGKG